MSMKCMVRITYSLMIVVFGAFMIVAARAETKYPVLAPSYAYAHPRHAGECRVGTVGTAFPTSTGCDVQVTASPVWVSDLGADRGILRFQYAFNGTSAEEFAGAYFTFGRSAVETVTTNGAAGPDIDLHRDGTFNLDRLPLTGDAPGAVDVVRISLRQRPPHTNLTVRVELEDANRAKGFKRFSFAPSNSVPKTVDLRLDSFVGGFDKTAVKILSLVVEENHYGDDIHNPRESGFDLLQIELVDDDGENRDAAWVASLSDRAFVYELAKRDFETLWRLSDAATGACMDRTMFRDLLHWGATGWLLAALPFAVEQGWITVAEAEARALKILRFLDNDAIWGDTPAGKVGNSLGLMYRFGGIDAAGLLGPLTGTRKIDLNKVNAVEASTIDTALFMMGAATCASGFPDATANQTEIRARVASLLSRTRWDELVDPTTRQFYMAWKPEIDASTTTYATPAAFGGYWASADASGSRALTIDYWTAEGAMAALLAVGSATHATSPELWYTMYRQVNQNVVLTWPGAWFTYIFLQSTYLDPGRGPDRGSEYGVRTVDWLTNTVAAFEVYKGLSGSNGIVLPDAVELPDITYEAQGLTNMAVGQSVRFTGTLTPYSLQMAIGLGGETTTAAISSLKQMLVQTPEMWDPLVGLLDSCHTNLATFPSTNTLLRQTGPWIQQQKWPLNCGAALLSELNYLTTGGVWRAAMRNSVLSNGVERIYRQATEWLALGPVSTNVEAAASTGRLVAVWANVSWAAATNAPWLSILSGNSGSGNGTVTYNVASNSGATVRTGRLVVAGSGITRTCTVVQAGAASSGWDAGYTDIGGGWRRLTWFGDYVPMGGEGWIWHNKHGFFFVSASSTPQNVWLYAQDMEWLYSSHTLYPFLFRASDSVWLWYNGSTNPRWFRNMTAGTWESRP